MTSRRRASYQRSRTVDAIPMHGIHQPLIGGDYHRNSLDSQDEANIGEESRLLGSSAEDSPFHGGSSTTTTGEPTMTGRLLSREYRFSSCRGHARAPAPAKNNSQRILSDCNLNHQKGGMIQSGSSSVILRKCSDNELYCSTASTARMLQRSPSSSSALLAKVKERIVDTFFQTSSEGPQLAAIVQERRQRAAEEYGARLSSAFRVQQHQSSRTSSVSSDPAGSTEKFPMNRNHREEDEEEGPDAARFDRSRREGARAAFRRRSVSEDNCLPQQSVFGGRSSLRRPMANGSTAGLGGIVCSSDDFQALASGVQHQQQQQQHRYRPRSKCMGPRAASFEPGRTMTRSGSTLWATLVGGDPSQRLDGSSKVLLETFEEGVDSAGHTEPGSAAMECQPGCEVLLTADAQTVTRYSRDSLKTTKSQQPLSPTGINASSGTRQDNRCLPAYDDDDDVKDGAGRASAVPPEVEFDADGQTWSVYGAELDPEILGNAIQMHLSRIIAKKKKSRTKSNDLSPTAAPPSDEFSLSTKHCPPNCEAASDDDVMDNDDDAAAAAASSPQPNHPRGGMERADGGCLRRYLCIFSGNSSSSSSNGINET